MLDTKQLGKRLAFQRKQSGMSQEKLAELLCVSPQAISKWENGHTMPDVALLPVLAQIFDCSIDEIIMPAYLYDADIEEKKTNKAELQARHIANYIIRQLGGTMPGESIGLDDAAIIEAIRGVYPNLGKHKITRKRMETHDRYISVFITVTTSQKELKLVEKVYRNDDKELLGYDLFCRHVSAVPQIYSIDFERRILLMEDLNDGIQGFCFDEDNENGKIFRQNYRVVLEETANVHAAFWENEAAFERVGLDWRHESRAHLLAHIDGMEQDFLAYRKKEEAGSIPKVWNGLHNAIEAEKLDCFQEAIHFLRERYVDLVDERFGSGKNITVVHGDLHPGNIFISKPIGSSVKVDCHSLKIIDMEAVRIGLCTEDLAMLMALHIEPDKKRAQPLLDYYYECLCRNVDGYSYENFMEDYKLSVMESMFYVIRLMNGGIYDFDMRDRAVRAYESFVAGTMY